MQSTLKDIKCVAVDILLPSVDNPTVRYRLRDKITILGYDIEAGFVTDGASVPRWLWGLYPPVDKYFLAAVVHDWLLVNGHGWTVANEHFKMALAACEVKPRRASAMQLGTRVYGYIRTHFFDDII